MAKIWKAVGILAAVLLIGGVLLAGAGLLTGASPDRVQDVLSGDLSAVRDMYDHARQAVGSLLPAAGLAP